MRPVLQHLLQRVGLHRVQTLLEALHSHKTRHTKHIEKTTESSRHGKRRFEVSHSICERNFARRTARPQISDERHDAKQRSPKNANNNALRNLHLCFECKLCELTQQRALEKPSKSIYSPRCECYREGRAAEQNHFERTQPFILRVLSE